MPCRLASTSIPALRTLALGLGLLWITSAWAQPRWVRLSYEGDASSSVTVSWNTDSATDSEIVRYGPTTQYGTEVSATDAPIPLPGTLGFVHQVQILGLEPETEYHYSVGGPGAWSADAIFRTAPADRCGGPLRFVALGDGRSQDDSGVDDKWHEILLDAVAHDPLFILDTGDLVKDGKSDPQWVDWLTETDAFNPYFPHQPSIGNHDDDTMTGDGAMYNDIFALPRNLSSGTEDFYWFTAGDAIFVAISSTTYNQDAFAQQAAWLDQVLTDNPRRWKFVWMHHPPYTSHANFFGTEFNHPPNEVNQNAALVPIFDKHHVDVVFAGHNHYYERFDPLNYNPGDVEQGQLASGFDTGTVYVITGGAGAFTYDEFDLGGVTIDLIDWVCSPFTAARGSAICSGKHHYTVVEIVDNVLTFEAITTRKQNFGDETPFTIETFQITKPDLGPCPPPDPTDGGTGDGGPGDGGADGGADAGPDAGGEPDAGTDPDAGLPDGGVPDGSTPDGGTITDAGTTGDGGGGGTEAKGCGCESEGPAGGGLALLLAGLLGLALPGRRRRTGD
ncbi:MAG: metallophosphoesterase family protein [Deltaproteobacteria bacterium]|nr:metallophosphoesterase family protein [Deltaproteobacteria bacterium]